MAEYNKCRQCHLPGRTLLYKDFFAIGKNSTLPQKDISEVIIDNDGFCQYCSLYNANYDPGYIKSELNQFLKEPLEKKSEVIVALSGGKDSFAALYLAVKELKLNVVAYTFDNGFIPVPVLEQSERICKDLGVELLVVRKELYGEFKNEYKRDESGKWTAESGIDFCQVCSKSIMYYLQQLCEKYRVNRLIFGNKTYTALRPKVSCLKTNGPVTILNLLFALHINKEKQDSILRELKWEDPELPGYTSNCLVPGFTAPLRKAKAGVNNDTGYIEMEVRSGAYTKHEAGKITGKETDGFNFSEALDKFFEYS